MKTGSYRITKEKREQLAQGLGWFSIGLGALEIFAPRGLSRLIGIRPRPGLMRLLGIREIIAGAGILTQPKQAKWLKARVTGDAMDLAFLGAGFSSKKSHCGRLAIASVAVVGVTALDYLACKDLSEGAGNQAPGAKENRGTVHFRKSMIISREPDELYSLWRRFEDLPKFMRHLFSVQSSGENRLHWVAKGPVGSRIEWDAEITQELPNELIAWRSLENADVDSFGSVKFEKAPGGRGTIVRVEMCYRPPAGKIGAKLAKVFGQSPEKQIAVDLLRFKQMVETGEIARTEGQPAGRQLSTSRKYDELVRA